MAGPELAAIIANLPATVPFVGPEVIERKTGIKFRARLGANESPFGPSPKVIAAIAGAASDVWTYGDSENYELKEALARHLGTPMETITIGEGIDGLLGLTCRLYLEPGDRIVTSLGAYPTFNYHVAAQGAECVTVPYDKNDRESLSGLLDSVLGVKPKIVYLANPDNPMGTWWDASEITRFVEAVPEDTLIILDEAYGETAPAGTLPPITLMRPNLLRYRTFSKAYGLAGMRVGYAIGAPRTIAGFDRIRNHFGVTKLSQIAATAALADQDYLARTIAAIAAGRDEIISRTKTLGLKPIPSATNFVAIDCGADDTYATMLLNGMQAHGIFIRKPAAPGLNRCIRMSVGTPKDIALACDVLEDIIKTENR
ncbi:histidinol-phosphate aminotransferase [Pelagibacterium halotolerans]|uniref:Biosynthetic Aromatic amino acid aminotransferase beta n=2 Tax=Pelagibacterium TaxID=1082930 RepID=G4RGV0_PELHB|nr:biosynthetic Aromatic amino acid aminotransferase beta [Pelagibacterium halotolerans B2]QJR20441.1 pyridoxal phosphate-dependent aminotransferase [Pelagibacterium halotolerans]SEA87849.1 histidinol-phosphate aminotransferase [Pelagibacterium halotolerans]